MSARARSTRRSPRVWQVTRDGCTARDRAVIASRPARLWPQSRVGAGVTRSGGVATATVRCAGCMGPRPGSCCAASASLRERSDGGRERRRQPRPTSARSRREDATSAQTSRSARARVTSSCSFAAGRKPSRTPMRCGRRGPQPQGPYRPKRNYTAGSAALGSISAWKQQHQQQRLRCSRNGSFGQIRPLGISTSGRAGFYEAVRTGRLPCHWVGRHIRFTRPMLDEWLAEQPRR